MLKDGESGTTRGCIGLTSKFKPHLTPAKVYATVSNIVTTRRAMKLPNRDHKIVLATIHLCKVNATNKFVPDYNLYEPSFGLHPDEMRAIRDVVQNIASLDAMPTSCSCSEFFNDLEIGESFRLQGMSFCKTGVFEASGPNNTKWLYRPEDSTIVIKS